MNTLLIEDDPDCARRVRRELSSLGHQVVCAENGDDTRRALLSMRFDALVVAQECFHWVTPGLRAFGLARFAPVLMLGPTQTSAHLERAMKAGVDGWLAAPFTPLELRAWISFLSQRRRPPAVMEISYADIVLNLTTYEVWIDHALVKLSRKDFALLRFLIENPERILAAEVIWNQVWSRDRKFFENLLHVYVSRLRALLAAHSGTACVRTFRGRGYSLQMIEPVESASVHANDDKLIAMPGAESVSA